MEKNQKSYGKENDLNLKVIIALARANQAVLQVAGKDFKEGGLTIAQFSVLEALYHKGDMHIGEIIEKTLSTGGNMTVVIDNLLKMGLVTKIKDPSDRRASVISLTESGYQLIQQIFPEHLNSVTQLFQTLDSQDKETLIQIIKKLTGKA